MNELIKISKFLSLILRHKPETIGLTLNENGWADTQELLKQCNTFGYKLSFEQLKTVVDINNKRRFAFSPDLTKIRANQGHSINVDLELKEKKPPDILFHGTAEKNIESIKEKGLNKRKRNFVHLSSDSKTAYNVGLRYGKPVILTINTGKMHEKGILFYLSENGVWLTDNVSPEFIGFP